MSNAKELSENFLSEFKFSFFENCTKAKPSKIISLYDFLSDIKNGKVKNEIKEIQKIKDKDRRTLKKKSLPSVSLSGLFDPSRNKKNLKKHSGLIQVDFDEVKDLAKAFELLKKDAFTLACFISPSGEGIKLIVRIPANGGTHEASFKALREYYRKKYNIEPDEKCSDVSRLCFLSYDKNIFVNTGAVEFTELKKTEDLQPSIKAKKNIIDKELSKDVETVIKRICEANKDITADYNDWLKIGFALAGTFKEAGRKFFHEISRFFPSYNVSECDKQFTACLQNEGKGVNIQTFFFVAQKHGIDIRTNQTQSLVIKPNEYPGKMEGFPVHTLYKVKKDQDGIVKDLNIQHTKFLELLQSFGFRRFDLEREFTFVKVKENVVEEISKTHIQDTFFRFLKSLPETLPDGLSKEFLREKFTKSPENYFSDTKLSLLEAETFKFCADNINEAFIFFFNGFVKCNKEDYTLYPYKEMQGLVWKNQILTRDFEKISIESNQPELMSVFAKFIWNVSGKEQDRYNSLCSIIGYLLHNQFEGKLKALILTDSDIADLANGRTGKTLFAKALARIRTLCEINGKDFDTEDRFKFQDVNLDTQIVHLNDVKKNFGIDKIFNDITEGISVQKKNKQPFRKNVKIILSTNKTVKIEGASAKDRVIEFEFVNHYHESFSPYDEFGKWFFGEGWTQQDWCNFDNFISHCLCLYLNKGVIKPTQINLNRRKLLDSTNEDFVNFIEERVRDGRIKANEIICKNELKNDFINENFECQLELKDVRKITYWLRNFANLSGYFAPNIHVQDETARNGKKYFIFRVKDYKRSNLKEFVPPV